MLCLFNHFTIFIFIKKRQNLAKKTAIFLFLLFPFLSKSASCLSFITALLY